jgi:hypothetical protein
MNLLIGAWYNEPNINFKFSHKVDNYIRERIKEFIMQPLGVLEIDKDKFINITIATDSNQEDLEVKFGKFTKRSEFFRVGFWFPYNKIINSENPLKEYLENYILAIKTLFDKWGVTDEQIEKLRQDIFGEILNNELYDKADEE